MKHLLIFVVSGLLWLFYPDCAVAQKEDNVWIFGYRSGLDFNSGKPIPVTTSVLSTLEGCASICDPTTGSLLFYSDGRKVYDRTDKIMMNGNDILGNEFGSATQGVGIFPIPHKPGIYYLFTLSSNESKESWLRYSVIDMSLNGGLGAVTADKNVPVDSGMSEKMVLTTVCGRSWLITHDQFRPIFYAYSLDGSILLAPPVISFSSTGGPQRYKQGEMNINKAGNKLVLANYDDITRPNLQGSVELYNFDHSTGIVSDGILLDTTSAWPGDPRPWVANFSPDASKLYIYFYTVAGNALRQYDLSSMPSIPAVLASRYEIGTYAAGLRLGTDNMLYLLRNNIWFARIRNPNAAGPLCDFEDYIPIFSPGGHAFHILGMHINGFTGFDTLFSRRDTLLCGDEMSYTVPYTNVTWNDGSHERNRILTHSGTYIVYGNYGTCDTYVDSIIVVQKPLDTAYYHKDTTVCRDTKVLIRLPMAYDTYTWQDGSTVDTIVISAPDTAASVLCTRSAACIRNIYSFRIYFFDSTTSLLPSDTVLCSGDTVSVDLIIPYASYVWQDSNRNAARPLTETGNYSVTLTADGCIIQDSMKLLVKELGGIGSDTTLCAGDAVTLTVNPDIGTYMWQDGSTLNQYHVTHPGIYSVRINNDGCEVTRSVDIRYGDCTICVAIDNAFTPNNDLLNDDFKIHYRCPVKQQLLLIYDRWGKEVFRSESSAPIWNGRINGMEASTGTYFYLLKVTFNLPDAKEEMFKGDITLIR